MGVRRKKNRPAVRSKQGSVYDKYLGPTIRNEDIRGTAQLEQFGHSEDEMYLRYVSEVEEVVYLGWSGEKRCRDAIIQR